MSLLRSSTICGLVGALALGACTNATGDLSGGQPRPFDAAAPAPLVVPITEPTYADASPTSWKGIYRDFFGRRAKATCAGNGTCHDTDQAAGFKRSNFVCADADGCYQSLTTAHDPDPRVSTNALVEQKDIASPDGAYLFKIIRYRTPDGTLVPNRGMPQLPLDYAFAPADIDRMKAWIRAGAKND
jgi:hypothetical protein